MGKLVRENIIEEGYGAGFSMNSFKGGLGGTTRGGFGGASNFGGQNSMYTYEVKPLNHTLEQKPTVDANSQVEQIQLGSKIRGIPVRSNATPDRKYVTGLVREIVQTDNGAIKYYIVQNEDNQLPVKIDPLTTKLVIFDPVEYYDDVSLTTDNITSRREEKIKALRKGKVVRESINEGSYDSELHHWLIRTLDRYNEGDSIEAVGSIFRKAFYPRLNKNQVYKKLAAKGIDNPKLIKDLFDRFDDLIRGAGNI
jgi:hypothetical protein